jgi:hypothetical protein
MIFPIIEAFGDTVLHGRVMPGQQLADGVKDQIRRSDTLGCQQLQQHRSNIGDRRSEAATGSRDQYFS